MSTTIWDETVWAWTTTVDSPVLGRLEVHIKTDGESSPPSNRQMATLDTIARLNIPAETLTTEAKRYAVEYLGEEEVDEFEDEDWKINFSSALIPPLRDSTDAYFFLSGDSEIDIEHGVACLFKNSDQFRICHSDYVYESYDWDDTALLDNILR